MNQIQKSEIIRMYEAAVRKEAHALNCMDEAKSDKTWAKYSADCSLAMGQREAIESVLSVFGYIVVINDSDEVEDIVELEGDDADA